MPGQGEGSVGTGGERLLGEGFLAVDGQVADFEDLVLVAQTTEDQPDELHQDEGDQQPTRR